MLLGAGVLPTLAQAGRDRKTEKLKAKVTDIGVGGKITAVTASG